MRSIRRLLTATAVGVAMTAASIAVAGPAAASPEDGQGCVGTPTLPASYVCLISLTPANALPHVTTTPIPVSVPPLCYFLDCTDATTVNVPVPSAGLNNGDVAVLWYQGKYYPIGIAIGNQVVAIALGAVALGVQEANKALVLAGQELAEAQQTIDDLRDQVPTSAELLAAVRELARPYQDAIAEFVDNLPTTQEILAAIRDNEWVQYVLWLVNELRQADWCSVVAGVGGLVTGPDAWSC